MAALQLGATQLFDGETTRHNVWLTIENGVITEIQDGICSSKQSSQQPSQQSSRQPLLQGLLTPGFVDLQVNGGGDQLFNQQPSSAALIKMVAAHQRFGTTAMLPTVITDEIEVMQQAADAVAHCIKQPNSGIAGIHFEGPHISLAKRGAHSDSHIRPISDAEWRVFSRTDVGVKMVTLAPETVTTEQIRRLTELGVIVSLGHSDASFEQATAAVSAGASGFTHLYNAMSPLQGREPGMVGAALASQHCFAGIICDGLHVDLASIGIAYRCLGPQRLALVTDAMPPVGGQLARFSLVGNKVNLVGDKLTGANGELAGSVLTMQAAVQMLANEVGLEPALQMATSTPAKWIKQPTLGRLQVGSRADMLLLDQNLGLSKAWRGGEPIEC